MRWADGNDDQPSGRGTNDAAGQRPRAQEHARKLARLRLEVQRGIDDLERGDFEEIDAGDLGEWMESLISNLPSRRR